MSKKGQWRNRAAVSRLVDQMLEGELVVKFPRPPGIDAPKEGEVNGRKVKIEWECVGGGDWLMKVDIAGLVREG